MGVEYYTCNYCGETFSDCGGFVICECGTKWCDDECAEADGYISEHCSLHPDLDDYDLMYDYRENIVIVIAAMSVNIMLKQAANTVDRKILMTEFY